MNECLDADGMMERKGRTVDGVSADRLVRVGGVGVAPAARVRDDLVVLDRRQRLAHLYVRADRNDERSFLHALSHLMDEDSCMHIDVRTSGLLA